MEKENRGKKVLEIILIILVALSFVLIPLLNQFKQKTISLNRSQLVNRQNVRNGTIDITDYQDGNVYTISAYFENYFDYDYGIDAITIDENKSLTGSNDVFGWGIPNYFRFYPVEYDLPNAMYEKALQFYIELNNNKFLIYNLAYYDINVADSDDAGPFINYRLITKNEFTNAGILARFDVLNISYYNSTSIDNFLNFVNTRPVLDSLLNITTNYQLRNNYFSFIHGNNVHFINIEQDTITSLISTIKNDSYLDGYYFGYEQGQSSNTTSVFSLLSKAASSISAFMNIEVLPNISMWLLISIPLSISIMIILLRLLRGGS